MALLYQCSMLLPAGGAMEAGVQTTLIAVSIIVVMAALAFAGYILIRNNKDQEQPEDQSSPGDIMAAAREDPSPADSMAVAREDRSPAETDGRSREKSARRKARSIRKKGGTSPARKPDVRPAEENSAGKTPVPVTEKAVIPLKISNIRIEPLSARPGEMVNIWFSATNLDSSQIGHQVILKINGQVFNVRQISILPNTIMHLNFKVMLTDPGSYTVDINGTTGVFAIVK